MLNQTHNIMLSKKSSENKKALIPIIQKEYDTSLISLDHLIGLSKETGKEDLKNEVEKLKPFINSVENFVRSDGTENSIRDIEEYQKIIENIINLSR